MPDTEPKVKDEEKGSINQKDVYCREHADWIACVFLDELRAGTLTPEEYEEMFSKKP